MLPTLRSLICITTVISSLQVFAKPFGKASGEIDDHFIDKLLASDKFEKVAEKIAQRAVDKALKRQHHSNENANDGNQEPAKSHSGEKEKAEKSAESKESVDQESKETHNTKYSSGSNSKAKINTEAAKQKFAEFPAGALSLNYKHFTTKDSKISQSQDNNVSGKIQKGRDKDEAFYKRVHDGSAEAEAKGKSPENAKDSDKNDKSASAYSGSESEEQTEPPTTTTRKTTPKEEETINEEHEKLKTKKHKKKDHKKSHKRKALKKHVKVSEEATTKLAETKQIVSEEEQETTSPVASGEDSKASVDTEKPPRKRKDFRHSVRRENGKLYTFMQSPDYEDYHNQFSKTFDGPSIEKRNRRK